MTDASARLAAAGLRVKPLEWKKDWRASYSVKSQKAADNGCMVVTEVIAADRYAIETVTKPGYFRCVLNPVGTPYPNIDAAKAAAYADKVARILAELTGDSHE